MRPVISINRKSLHPFLAPQLSETPFFSPRLCCNFHWAKFVGLCISQSKQFLQQKIPNMHQNSHMNSIFADRLRFLALFLFDALGTNNWAKEAGQSRPIPPKMTKRSKTPNPTQPIIQLQPKTYRNQSTRKSGATESFGKKPKKFLISAVCSPKLTLYGRAGWNQYWGGGRNRTPVKKAWQLVCVFVYKRPTGSWKESPAAPWCLSRVACNLSMRFPGDRSRVSHVSRVWLQSRQKRQSHRVQLMNAEVFNVGQVSKKPTKSKYPKNH